MKHKYAGLISIPIIAAIVLFCSSVRADYPEPKDQYVNDYAKLLTEYDRNVIRDLFIQLEQNTGKQAVVVTIESIRDYQTGDNTIETFATNLFNTWGVGNKENNDGVMILIARKDRKCRIELGGGYGVRYNAAMQEVIDKHMLPHFKRDKYSMGIREGATYAAQGVCKKISAASYYRWEIVAVIIGTVLVVAGISCVISGKKGWGWMIFAGVGFLLTAIIGILHTESDDDYRYGSGRSYSSGGSSGGGFGGGSSFGGGASGSW